MAAGGLPQQTQHPRPAPLPRQSRCRVAPQEPLVLLCIAAALLNQAATKRVPNRHRAVLQAFAFLQEYSDARWAAGRTASWRGQPGVAQRPGRSPCR